MAAVTGKVTLDVTPSPSLLWATACEGRVRAALSLGRRHCAFVISRFGNYDEFSSVFYFF
jgi:hypothetical protein